VRAFEIKATSEAANEGILEITFHHTVRVPDNGNTYGLPPDLDEFSIFSVQDFSETLSNEYGCKRWCIHPHIS
jgi:hypothetical protein